jgi:coenzyme PQQ synthesis protein D (PqqD)
VPDRKQIARVPSSVLSREVQGEAILLHLDTGEYFGLNEVGARIWQLIIEKGDLGEVESAMRAEFDAGEPQISSDLDRLVDELVRKQLLEVDTV